MLKSDSLHSATRDVFTGMLVATTAEKLHRVRQEYIAMIITNVIFPGKPNITYTAAHRKEGQSRKTREYPGVIKGERYIKKSSSPFHRSQVTSISNQNQLDQRRANSDALTPSQPKSDCYHLSSTEITENRTQSKDTMAKQPQDGKYIDDIGNMLTINTDANGMIMGKYYSQRYGQAYPIMGWMDQTNKNNLGFVAVIPEEKSTLAWSGRFDIINADTPTQKKTIPTNWIIKPPHGVCSPSEALNGSQNFFTIA